MNRSSKVIAISTLTSLSIVGVAGDSRAPRLSGAPGDVWVYNVTTLVGSKGVFATLEGRVTHQVLTPGASDQILVRETPSNFSARGASGPTGPGSPIPTVPITASYRADGSVAKILGDAVQPAAYRLVNLETIKLPDASLALNLEWNWQTNGSPSAGVVPMKATYRVVGEELASGFDAWKIEFSGRELGYETGAGTPEATITGTAWIRKSDNKLLGLEDFGYHLPVPGKDLSVTVDRRITVTFIPELEVHAPPPPTELTTPAAP